MKCGTPIGRIVDELGDSMQMTMTAVMLGYIVRLPPCLLTLGYGFCNLAFYIMESNHWIHDKLFLTNGEMGPVEAILVLAFLFAMAGVYGLEFL